jgi:putative Holliday junction resolvase
MDSAMRALGLDVGTKTVGLALSDELGWTAQPLFTVRRTRIRDDVQAVLKAVDEHQVSELVVGLPLNMDGSEGPRAAASRAFALALEQAGAPPISFWDERLSTVAVERVLIEADVSRAKRKQVVDQLAAAYILQGWLDAKRGLPEDGPLEP